VPADKRDPNLRERIATERDGILIWALEGLRRLIDNSYLFTETTRTREEVTRYRIESNSVLTFVDEMCEIGTVGDAGEERKAESSRSSGNADNASGRWIAREELYTRYKDYCSTNGLKAQSQTNFNKEIDSSFAQVHRGQDKISGRKVWRGITFVEGGKE